MLAPDSVPNHDFWLLFWQRLYAGAQSIAIGNQAVPSERVGGPRALPFFRAESPGLSKIRTAACRKAALVRGS
jgi:hypothetical protein